MNTLEARSRMLDLARDVETIVEDLATGTELSRDERQQLRDMVGEARTVLPDAGYPAEVVWRCLQRASIGLDTSFDQTDRLYWQDVANELRAGIATLESLVSPHLRRESDFRVVG